MVFTKPTEIESMTFIAFKNIICGPRLEADFRIARFCSLLFVMADVPVL